MVEERPQIIENRQFVNYEEEDIQRLNRTEREKFVGNPQIAGIMETVEQELGAPGHWEEHWITTDTSGRRVLARIYYSKEKAWALTADGEIVREIEYPKDDKEFH